MRARYFAMLLAASCPLAAQAATDTVLQSFRFPKNGETFNGVIKVNDAFYGTTHAGGANGLGTIYKLSHGIFTKLYDFQGGADGAVPRGQMVHVGGALYGTTTEGGTGSCADPNFGSCGTVFKYDLTTNAESVIYSFQGSLGAGGMDGANPFGTMVYYNGLLYGTTALGGNLDNGFSSYDSMGTVFSVTLGGTEQMLYAFNGNSDGAIPIGGVIVSGGKLYGTTAEGGACPPDPVWGCGIVFKLTPPATGGNPWTEHVIHRFQGGPGDGAAPYSGLVKNGGVFYGTTFYGGFCWESPVHGCGTVFSVTPQGVETVVHEFFGDIDGSQPYGGLIVLGGELYGTTAAGGDVSGCQYYTTLPDGCGTIFKLVPGGIQTLYSFDGSGEGGNPFADLFESGHSLFGTTYGGGAHGRGTLYKFTP